MVGSFFKMLPDLENISFQSYMRFNFRCASVYQQIQFLICVLYYLGGFAVPNLLIKIKFIERDTIPNRKGCLK